MFSMFMQYASQLKRNERLLLALALIALALAAALLGSKVQVP